MSAMRLGIIATLLATIACAPGGGTPDASDLVECGGPAGANGVNAQFTTASELVHAAGTAKWSSAQTLIESTFVTIPQVDIEFLVQNETCTHKLTLNVRAPKAGVIPYGLQSTNGASNFSGGYAGDLESQLVTDESTLEVTSITDTAVSGRFKAVGGRGHVFDFGAFTNVVITGQRPPVP